MSEQDLRWPGGKRIAVLFNLCLEQWSDGKAPGISPMGNPLKPGFPDLNARGWADYAYRRGVFRMLDGFAHYRIKATVMVSGILAERFPHIVKQIADASRWKSSARKQRRYATLVSNPGNCSVKLIVLT